MSCYILVVKNLEGFSRVYHVLRLGIADYEQAHDLQKKILQERIDGKCPDHNKNPKKSEKNVICLNYQNIKLNY